MSKLFEAPTADAKTIAKMQSAWIATSNNFRHQTAVLFTSCALHMIEHGNATPMTVALRAAHASAHVRSDAVMKWALNTGLFRAAKETVMNPATGKEEKIDVFKKNEKAFDETKAEYEKDKAAFTKALLDTDAFTLKPPKSPWPGYDGISKLYAILDGLKKVEDDEDKATHPGTTGLDLLPQLEALLKDVPRPSKKKKEGGDMPPSAANDGGRPAAAMLQ